jgi:hypothetical protein
MRRRGFIDDLGGGAARVGCGIIRSAGNEGEDISSK